MAKQLNINQAKEVAEWIEHSNTRAMIQTVDEDEKVKVNNVYAEDRTGGNGTWFLTEDGLYEVFMQSRKPIAKQFKKKIKEILKEIRKTGSYSISKDPQERLAEIIKDCTFKEQVDLIRDLYKIPHKYPSEPQNHPSEARNSKDSTQTLQDIKVLKNDDIEDEHDRYETIDAFFRYYKVQAGDLTRDVYEKYVNYCISIKRNPRTRMAFVVRMKQITKLDTIIKHQNGVHGSVIINRR